MSSFPAGITDHYLPSESGFDTYFTGLTHPWASCMMKFQVNIIPNRYSEGHPLPMHAKRSHHGAKQI